jgi:transcriptional regulator with XRE-family HTH domain
LGEHLKKRRDELGLWQRQAAADIGVSLQIYRDWEKGRAVPYASSWRLVTAFLGYDPSPAPMSLGGRLKAKRRELGFSLKEAAERLGWDPETVRRYEHDQWMLRGDRLRRLQAFLRWFPK